MRFVLSWITVFIGLCSVATYDFESSVEWDACKTDLTGDVNADYFWFEERKHFSPPNCILANRTVGANCEYFNCHSRLPQAKHISYFSSRYLLFDSNENSCSAYLRLPVAVHILDLSLTPRKRILKANFSDISDLQSVQSLLLIGSGVLYIDDDVLGNLSSLECVNLDKHKSLGSDGRPLLQQLLSVPTLRRLSARRCGLTELMQSSSITASSVMSLWFTGNNIENIDGTELTQTFFNISFLDLSANDIKHTFTGVISSTLQTLNLSNNLLTEFPYLCHDTLTPGHFVRDPSCPNLNELNLANNRIRFAQYHHDIIQCLPNLRYLDLSGNKIDFVFSDFFVLNFIHLQYLNLQFQNSAFVYMAMTTCLLSLPLLELRLENHNQFRFDQITSEDDIKIHFLYPFPNLQRLFLNGSNFHLVEEETFVAIFGHLKYLQTLSMPNCKLDFVPAAVFPHFSNLSALVLRDNFLTTIPVGCFDSLTQLTQLDLSGNKIITLGEQTFSPVLRGRLSFLDVSLNPLACSCDLMWFRNWFRSQPKVFTPSASVHQCYNFQRKINMSDYVVNVQSCLLSHEVNSMIIFCCSVIIITLTSFTLLFRYRWHLRLVLYEAFRGRDDVRRQRLEQGNFDHDVFVSYASEDLNWVRQNLMPQLEERLHLRLCIHDRQFIPGKNIVDNIADCVEKSKKILMVFSKNFMRSQWCQFELAYCLSHVLEHDDAMIILCVDDVVSHDMPSAMMAVLKTTTYIQWERQPDAVRSFWGRLDIALEEILHHAEHAV